MSSGNESCLGECAATLAVLYTPYFNYFFFGPQYANDYCVTREPMYSFIDEYQGEVMAGFPRVISQRNVSALSISGFIDQNEEGSCAVQHRDSLRKFPLSSLRKW